MAEKRLRLGDPVVPKPDNRHDAPDHMYIECVDGYLRVMRPGDWIDFKGTVHYVQAGAPNVLSAEEAKRAAAALVIAHCNRREEGLEVVDEASALQRRLWAFATADTQEEESQ